MYPTGQLDPAQPIRGKAIELNAPTLVFLDDSGCRKASSQHMMGAPQ